MRKKPPKFVGTETGRKVPDLNDDKLRSLGIELSKKLPTYDVPIDLIEPNEFNPNEMDDATFNRLVQEIDETGFIDPIQIAPSEGGKFRIIGGEHRWQGVRTLGWDKIPCNILLDEKFVDVDLQELLTVRLNVIRGGLNPEKFLKLYEKRVSKYGAEQLQALFGFTSTDAWEKITRGVQDTLEKSGIGGEGIVKEFVKKTKKTKTIDGLGSILKSLFKKYGSDLEHSFMVFSYGGKQHVYIVLTDKALSELEKIIKHCRDKNVNINDVLNPLLENASKGIGRCEEKK
jgi:hypothetical protein